MCTLDLSIMANWSKAVWNGKFAKHLVGAYEHIVIQIKIIQIQYILMLQCNALQELLVTIRTIVYGRLRVCIQLYQQ